MKTICPTYRIDAGLYKLKLEEGTSTDFSLKTTKGNGLEGIPSTVILFYPPDTDFADARMQTWLHKVILESMRKQAKLLLPDRLRMHAKRLELTFERTVIKQNKSNWGSCARHKATLLSPTYHNINLSLYLLLLPLHLIDYVLMHELAHIHEMNHSERFWQLLGSYTHCDAKLLRKEIRGHQINF